MSTTPTDKTKSQQSGLVHFKPGQSGNPAGRPKGARSKLGEAFLEALRASFEEHGPDAIERVRINKPETYMTVIAGLLPKQVVGEDDGPLQLQIVRRVIVDPQS
jgi:hypothetical protein